MRPIRNFGVLFLCLMSAVSLIAQGTPSDVRDLVGLRAAAGETQLRNRGYGFVRTQEGNDRKWTTWWNSRTNTCITVTTLDGRYNSIVDSPPADCNRNGGWNGGGWGSGGGNGQAITPPSWAQGTFYGTAPDGSQIQLTINRDGGVSAIIGGSPSYGNFTRGNYLNMGGAIASVARQGNGIVTTRNDTGERIVYSRGGWGGGSGSGGGWGGGSGGGWGGDQAAAPPSWARGTFYGTAPDGSQILLTITSNGSVTANIGGSMSQGIYTRNNYLNMGGARATVARQGNGIVTTRTDNGERIVYTRGGWNNGGGGWNNGGNYAQFEDLVGSRASSGESTLRSRGFRNVDSFREGNTRYTIWWRSSSRQCVQAATVDGRYDSVVDIGSHAKCN